MALDAGVLVLVLFAAVLHATWNALVKAGGDRLAVTTLVMLVPASVGVVLLFFLPVLAAPAWPFLILSALVHYVYFTVLIGAYRHGDLSQVYPIARGAAPALVALEAWVFAGEALRAAEVAGVLVVSAGIMSLAWRRRAARGVGEARAIGYALLTALTIAVYLLADGLGVRRAGHPLAYICWLFVLQGFPMLGFALWRRRGGLGAAFGPSLKAGLLGGVVAGISYGIAMWAMSLGPLAHIVAIRETSVVFAAAIGALLLKEPFGRARIAASAVVAAGALLLQAGG